MLTIIRTEFLDYNAIIRLVWYQRKLLKHRFIDHAQVQWYQEWCWSLIYFDFQWPQSKHNSRVELNTKTNVKVWCVLQKKIHIGFGYQNNLILEINRTMLSEDQRKIVLNKTFYKIQTCQFKDKSEDMFIHTLVQMIYSQYSLFENIENRLQQSKGRSQGRERCESQGTEWIKGLMENNAKMTALSSG